ncbi:kinesin-like protein KIF3C isoform X2 [Anolis carolinensis]|uniref:kinesin-like protein KIF3C isoform X2 n=1 Tax=Anolis carolinensis TaxID=28377 RepID=UPI002F2B383B
MPAPGTGGGGGGGGEALRVVARCRGLSRREASQGAERAVFLDRAQGQVLLRASPGDPAALKSFSLDGVFGGGGGEEGALFAAAAAPVVEAALGGVNGTLLCYGQSGSGKTFSLFGPGGDGEEGADEDAEIAEGESEDTESLSDPVPCRGLLPLAAELLFARIAGAAPEQRFLVRASFLEVYLEEVRDLLAPPGSGLGSSPRRLELKESPERGVYLKDLSAFVTKDAAELRHVLRLGQRCRARGATAVNPRSSRSHAVVLLTIECSQDGEAEPVRVGKLHLVDLAGGERQGRGGGVGVGVVGGGREAARINLSLSALGHVIWALAEGRCRTHVPYRDSKLTRLLQDSLGGSARTALLATLSPASLCLEESLSTLRFAGRAKRVRNRPRVNEDPKDALLREFRAEVARLKAQLQKRGMLGGGGGLKHRHHHRQRKKGPGGVDNEEDETEDDDDDNNNNNNSRDGTSPQQQREEDGRLLEKKVEGYLKAQKERLEQEKAAIQDDRSLVSEEKARLLEEKESMLGELRKERQATEHLAAKYKAMESKLLIGGRNIMDHTNEQQKMLELKRQEIAEQKRREREIQQQMLLRNEETMELRETFTSLQQEVEIKTKKLKKLYAKLQAVKAEIQDQHDEYIRVRQDLEEAQNEQTRELKLKYLIIENFIPPEEKNKIMNRLYFDCEEDQWKFQPLVLGAAGPRPTKAQIKLKTSSSASSALSSTAGATQMKRRPASAVGYKRPISQYARLAMSMGSHPRYRAENIMFLELDVSPPTIFEFEITGDPAEQDPRALHLERLTRLDSLLEPPAASRVRKSRSWCQAPRPLPSSTSHVSLASGSQTPPTAAAAAVAAHQ